MKTFTTAPYTFTVLLLLLLPSFTGAIPYPADPSDEAPLQSDPHHQSSWDDLSVELQDTIIQKCSLDDIPHLSQSARSVLQAVRRKPGYDLCLLTAAMSGFDDIETALIESIKKKRVRAAKLLIEHGADLTEYDYQVFEEAARVNNRELFNLMWQKLQQAGERVPMRHAGLYLYARPEWHGAYLAAKELEYRRALEEVERIGGASPELIRQLKVLMLQFDRDMGTCGAVEAVLDGMDANEALALLRETNKVRRDFVIDEQECHDLYEMLYKIPNNKLLIREFFNLISRDDEEVTAFAADISDEEVIPIMLPVIYSSISKYDFHQLALQSASNANHKVMQQAWQMSSNPELVDALIERAILSDNEETFRAAMDITHTKVSEKWLNHALNGESLNIIRYMLVEQRFPLDSDKLKEIIRLMTVHMDEACRQLFQERNHQNNIVAYIKVALMPLAKYFVETLGLEGLIERENLDPFSVVMLTISAGSYDATVDAIVHYEVANDPITYLNLLYAYAIVLEEPKLSALLRIMSIGEEKIISETTREPEVTEMEMESFLKERVVNMAEILEFLVQTRRADPKLIKRLMLTYVSDEDERITMIKRYPALYARLKRDLLQPEKQ